MPTPQKNFCAAAEGVPVIGFDCRSRVGKVGVSPPQEERSEISVWAVQVRVGTVEVPVPRSLHMPSGGERRSLCKTNAYNERPAPWPPGARHE